MATRTVPFFTAVSIDALGSGLFLPLSLLYFAKVPKIDLVTVGVLLSVAAAVSLPVPVLVGQLVDRFGPRAVLIGAQVVQAAAFFGYLGVTGPATLVPAAVLAAAGQRAFWSSVFTLVADVAEKSGGPTDRWFALVGMAQTAGFGLGGLLSGLLLGVGTESTFRMLALANAVSFVVAGVLLLFVRAGGPAPRTSAARGGYRVLLADRPYQALIVTNAVFALCSVFLGVALPIYVVEGLAAPGWYVGPLLAGNTLLLALSQTLAVRVVRPLSRPRALMLSGALWTVWAAGSALAASVPVGVLLPYLAVCTLFFTAAELIHNPVSNALAAAAAPADLRGRYLAIFQYSFTLATVVAPVLFTVLFTASHTLPWLALGALALVGTIAMNAVGRRLPAAEAAEPAEAV
ncbi:MAG TPA: MFS transporter [Actinophytocola sp.]|jgi:MFS family permease|nr:MFS transporter [Actinophytocola sp.]